MIMKRLDMRIIKEILRLKFESKLSNRNIARSLNISRGVVNNYLKRFTSDNINWPLQEDIDSILLNLLDNNKETASPSANSNHANVNCEYIFNCNVSKYLWSKR